MCGLILFFSLHAAHVGVSVTNDELNGVAGTKTKPKLFAAFVILFPLFPSVQMGNPKIISHIIRTIYYRTGLYMNRSATQAIVYIYLPSEIYHEYKTERNENGKHKIAQLFRKRLLLLVFLVCMVVHIRLILCPGPPSFFCSLFFSLYRSCNHN